MHAVKFVLFVRHLFLLLNKYIIQKLKVIVRYIQKLTEKQKKELEKIKKYLEKENEKAREHQKIRGVR